MNSKPTETSNVFATVIAVAVGILVFLLQINIDHFKITLDAAWGEVLNWAIAHGAQWGKSLEFTYGPLGFVSPALPFDPATYWPTLLLQTGLAAITAVLVVANLRKLTLASGLAFALATIILGWSWSTSSSLIIVYPLAAMTLESISVYSDARRIKRHVQVAALATFVALLPLIKFSVFPLWLVWLPFGALVLYKSCDRLLICTFILVNVLAPVAAWLCCGQHLGNLIPWLYWSLQIAMYYAQAMQMAPLLPVTDWVAFIATMFWLTFITLIVWRTRHSLRRSAVYLMFAAVIVLTYKAGNTRANDGGHLMLMWSIYAWCAPLLVGLWCQQTGDAGLRKSIGSFLLAILSLTLVQVCQAYPPFTLHQLYRGKYSFSDARRQLHNLLHPVEAYDAYLAQWSQDRAGIKLPLIRQAIGLGSVDLLFNDQSVLLANGLNYKPRPIFQSYSAYSRQLAELNASFLQSRQAPRWIMLKWQVLGDNYPTSEDARALIVLLQYYQPVLSEDDFLLFRRQQKTGIRPSAPSAGVTIPLRFKSMTHVPEPHADAWFARLDVHLTPYGKLDSLLFRPPKLKLKVMLDDGNSREYVIARDIARSGFMLSPAIDSNNAYLSWLQGNHSHYVTSVELVQQKVFNHGAFKINSPLHIYPLILPHHYEPTLSLFAGLYPGFDKIPVSLPSSSRIFAVDGKPVLFLPAPGLLTFHLSPGTYTVSAQFGLMPNALTNRGCLAAHADGIGIQIDASADKQSSLMTYINPFLNRSHQYAKRISGIIKIGNDRTATVAITTGPRGSNGACDWSWIRDLHFERKAGTN
jgi:hypothetical protein